MPYETKRRKDKPVKLFRCESLSPASFLFSFNHSRSTSGICRVAAWIKTPAREKKREKEAIVVAACKVLFNDPLGGVNSHNDVSFNETVSDPSDLSANAHKRGI